MMVDTAGRVKNGNDVGLSGVIVYCFHLFLALITLSECCKISRILPSKSFDLWAN